MSLRAGPSLAVAAITLLIVVAGTQSAAAQQPPQLPVGESKGVKLVRDDSGSLVWVFTTEADRLHRRIRGKRVFVSCTDLPDVRMLGGDEIGSGTQYEFVPRHGRVLSTGDLTGWDYCRLFLPARKRRGQRQRTPRKHLVSIPLTQDGAVYLDGQRKNVRLTLVLTLAGSIADERHQTTWPLLDDFPAKARTWLRIVPLAGPQDDPPPGMVGYFSDGQQHVAVSVLTATGERLFLELEAGDVVRTNTFRYPLSLD